MSTVVSFENRVELPLNIGSLAEFRQWTHAPDFPTTGRIDFLPHRIEVDTSPEDIYCHGRIKSRISSRLDQLASELDLGDIFVDGTRVVAPEVGLSVEPDIFLVTHQSLEEGRVQLVPGASHEPGRYVEFEGGPDLIVEIVSDSSEDKDLRRLPALYFASGVTEYWLVDARGDNLLFQIHERGKHAIVAIIADEDGYTPSPTFGRSFRLNRSRNRMGNWQYQLEDR